MRLFNLIGIVLLALIAVSGNARAGTVKYTDGSHYEGELKNRNRSGEGTMYYADGDVLTATNWDWDWDVPGGFMRWDRKNGDVTYLHRGRIWYDVKYGDNKKLWFKRPMMFYKILKVPVNGMLDTIGMVTEVGYGTTVVEDVMSVNYGPKSMQVAPRSCGMDTVWPASRSTSTMASRWVSPK